MPKSVSGQTLRLPPQIDRLNTLAGVNGTAKHFGASLSHPSAFGTSWRKAAYRTVILSTGLPFKPYISANRFWFRQDFCGNDVGFRVALSSVQ